MHAWAALWTVSQHNCHCTQHAHVVTAIAICAMMSAMRCIAFSRRCELRAVFCEFGACAMSLEEIDPEYAAFAAVLAAPVAAPAPRGEGARPRAPQWEQSSPALMAFARAKLSALKAEEKCERMAATLSDLRSRWPMLKTGSKGKHKGTAIHKLWGWCVASSKTTVGWKGCALQCGACPKMPSTNAGQRLPNTANAHRVVNTSWGVLNARSSRSAAAGLAPLGPRPSRNVACFEPVSCRHDQCRRIAAMVELERCRCVSVRVWSDRPNKEFRHPAGTEGAVELEPEFVQFGGPSKCLPLLTAPF